MKKYFSFIVFTFALLLCSNVSFAAKALTRPISVTLQDGRHTTIYMYGDEHFHFFLSAEGERIVREGNVWRTATEWDLMSAKENYQNMMKKTGEEINSKNPFPHNGTPKVLVIMAQFSDREFTYTNADIDSLLNGRNYDPSSGYHSYSSMAQYFSDMSGEQFRPEFDIYGPVTLPNTAAYYGQDNGKSIDANYSQFVKDACMMADSLGVDFSAYDNYWDDDCVDLVFIVHAGFGQNMSGEEDDLWAKSGVGSYGSYDGKGVSRFLINQELLGYGGLAEAAGWDSNKLIGIGVMTHEFCHALGLPDFYPTISWDDVTNYNNQSMEEWDLMDGGENVLYGCCPTPLTAFERELFGWSGIDTLTYATDIALDPLQNGGKAYKIINPNDDTLNEYYVLENIPSGDGTGWYRKMRGKGMLVTHINYDRSAFYNFSSPNNTIGKPRITILPADSVLTSSYSVSANLMTSKEFYADEAGDPYPGTGNVTELTDWREWYPTMNGKLTDISQDEAGTVTFSFVQTEEEIDAITDVTSSQTDACTYNVIGQRVNGCTKGVMIRNGKKYLVR